MKKHLQLRKNLSVKEKQNNDNNVEILKLKLHSQAFKIFSFFFRNQLVLELKLFKPPSKFSEFFALKFEWRDGLP